MKKSILALAIVSLLTGCAATQQDITIPTTPLEIGSGSIEILVTEDRKVAWRNRKPGQLYTPVDRNALVQTILSEIKPGQVAVISANGKVPFEVVMKIADDLRKNGQTKIRLLVDQRGLEFATVTKSSYSTDLKDRREAALRDAFRKDAIASTGISVTQNSSYGEKVRACVQPGVSFPTPPRSSATNPAAQFRVYLEPSGRVADVSLIKSSGNAIFDKAVQTGIRRCTPFPTLPSGKYPSYVDVNYNMYD